MEAAIARGLPDELLLVAIAVSLDPPDCAWAQEVCLRLAALRDPHEYVRGQADAAASDVEMFLGWTLDRPE